MYERELKDIPTIQKENKNERTLQQNTSVVGIFYTERNIDTTRCATNHFKDKKRFRERLR